MKKLFALVLTLVLCFSLVACTAGKTGEGESAEKEIFKVGTFCPLSGSSAEYGQACLESVNLWAKRINEAGGLLGKYTIEVVAYDDGHDASMAVPAATKLINNDEIDVCVGSQASACIVPVVDMFEEAQIPLFGNGTSPSFMELGMNYTWRATVNQNNTIYELAKIMKELNFDTCALFTLQDEAGQLAGDSMEKYLAEMGIEVVTREYCTDGDTDYSGQAAKIVAANPDCVFIGTSYPPIPIFANAMRDIGYDGLIFGKDTILPEMITAANGNLNEYVFAFPSIVYSSVDQAGDNAVLRDFLEAYNKEYGHLPLVESCYRAYDSCLVIEEAVKLAGSIDSVAINDAISKVKMLGVQGQLDFTNSHEGLGSVNRWVVVNDNYQKLDKWISDGDYQAYVDARKWRA